MSVNNILTEVAAKRRAASVASYTQTYTTASRTVPNATAAAVATTGLVDAVTGNFAYDTAAQGDAVAVAINAIIADVDALRKVVTAIIDDLQTMKVLP